jgi:AmmeMemoRadiSam system protein A
MFTAATGKPDTAALERPAPAKGPLQASDKAALLRFARESIRRFLTTQTAPLARGFSPRTLREQGAFVTLRKHGELRGCIGMIAGDGPLARLVGAMALQAAFYDQRFQPLAAAELPQIEIEISVLTPPRAVAGPSDIVAGRDGVVLKKDGRSAVFLPQVAVEQGWTRDEMLDNLALKAGLPRSAWRKGASFSTFQADVFAENK